MEQNQSQEQLQSQVTPKTQQQQWEKVRNQFANNQESISQSEDVIALIEKWIWIQYEQEFKQFERKLQERAEINRNIKQILAEIIQQQKHASWMINQKYSMEQVNELIVKLRESIVSVLNSQQNINPQALQQQLIQKDISHMKMSSSPNQQEHIDKRLLANYSSVLPQIKPKGKIYHPKEMSSSFHISKQTQQDYQIRSPFMFEREKKLIELPKQGLFNNKYLKMTFKGFCKQGYNSNGLFEDISKDADKMTLNKWMIFCKEFSFVDKFHKSELVSIYQAATKFSSVMYLQDFLTAVAILQQKHVNKFHTGQYNFVSDVLKIGTQAAFKVKMDNLKVSYAGPRRNFFEYATYSQGERAQEIQRQKVYQVKKKERQIVLIKGMFEDHLKDQIQQLKTKREINKNTSRLGYSLNKIEDKQNNLDQTKNHNTEQTNNTRSSRIRNLNYSKLFQINRGQTTKKDPNYNTNITNQQFPIANMYKTELKNESKLIQHKKIEAKTMKNNINQTKAVLPPPINIDKTKKQEYSDTTWLTKIRTDSEQSDQILKQHLMIEKKIKNTKESSKVQDIMSEMQQRARQVQRIKQQIEKQNQQDNDMVQTQVNFNQQRQGTRV